MRDLDNNISPVVALPPAARTANINGNGVDLRGFGMAAILFTFGAWSDGTHAGKLQESDDGATNWTDVAAGDMTGSLAAVSSASGQNAVQSIGYIGNKRFIRPVLTISGATTGAVSDVIVLRAAPSSAPTA